MQVLFTLTVAEAKDFCIISICAGENINPLVSASSPHFISRQYHNNIILFQTVKWFSNQICHVDVTFALPWIKDFH